MMSWRSLKPKTIVAAAEAVAQRKADGRNRDAAAAGRAPSGPTAAGTTTATPHAVNDVGAASPRSAAE
jgi:hypothetical protein